MPGEDKTVNNMTETKLRQLFDTGHGKKGEEKKNVLEISEEEEGGEDLKNEEAAPGKAGGKAVLLKDKKLVQAKASKTTGNSNSLTPYNIVSDIFMRADDSSNRRRKQYGRWYIKPRRWEHRRVQELDRGFVEKEEKSGRGKQGTEVDKVDFTVSQLHSTKAFASYLAMKKCKKPAFIKYIMGPPAAE